ALLAPVLDRIVGRATGWILAALLAGLFVLTLTRGPEVLGEGSTIEQSLAWMPELGVELHLRMDGTAWLFSVLVTGIGALVLAYAARYFPAGRPQTGFYFFISAFAASMQGLVLADAIITMLVFCALTPIA